jgi:hypothetical protein
LTQNLLLRGLRVVRRAGIAENAQG